MDQAKGDVSASDKTKVFISYSRKDGDFVNRLTTALAAQNHLDVFRDTADILPTEEWKNRLERLIGEADTIVFCLSPDSVASEVCRWEVELADRLQKRIAPIAIREVDGNVPMQLSKRNYIFFTRADEFDRSLDYLISALDADIGWIREHTRLGELSRRWERSGRPKEQLLRGSDVEAAEAWLKRQPRNAPTPTETTQSYISQSRDEERAQRRRGRRVQGLIYVLLVSIIAGLVGWMYQATLQEQLKWLFVSRPYRNASVLPYVLTAEADRALKPGAQFQDCPDCPAMVVIPAGSFVMGSPVDEKGRSEDEAPQHEVTIGYAFAVSKFEITVAQWDLCVTYGNCTPRLIEPGDGDDHSPVVKITWPDAKRYVAWLSRMTGKTYRLLSEAEWEYAARGGTRTAYPWGDDVGTANAVCESCGSEWDRKSLAPVGSLAPNPFGLHDMHGNAWEWTEDCYHLDYKNAPADGSPWLERTCLRRSVRGGSFDYSPGGPRSATRYRYVPSSINDDLGMRIARSIERP